jgi:enoyl-[acyl-carrier protein] reductase II
MALLRTAVCDLLDIEFPIIQGGMAHVGTAELVSAVSNAGGLGIIGTGHYQPEWVREQIRRTKENTRHPFGVNLTFTSPYIKEVIDVILSEKIALISTGAGNPGDYVPRFKQAGIKFMPVVASVNTARRMEKAGADIIVAEGMESGGRIGETTTFALIPQVVEAVTVPVIAAGGIADGRGLAAALAMGAQGIQMGTRFVCSTECTAHADYKQKIVEANDTGTVVTHRTLGYPLRTLRNAYSDQFNELEKAGLSRDELELFDRDRMYLGLIAGDIEEGALLAGQIAGLIKDIKPVKDIIKEIVTGAEMEIARLKKVNQP